MPSLEDITLRQIALLAGVILLYTFLSLLSFNQIEEDAFIYFRFAENLAEGHGYVFNRGGERVEAGSSLLWLLLLTTLYKLPVDMLFSTKLLGLAFGVANLALSYRLARSHIANPLLQLLPPLLMAVSTPFVMSNQRGLETPLYAFLVLVLCLCCTEDRLSRYWVIPAVLLLAGRPEGFFILAALLPVFWFRRGERKTILISVAILIGAALILLALRFFYFHDLVPNPFYTKMAPGGPAGWHRAHGLFRNNFIYVFALPLLLTIGNRSFWNAQRIILVGFLTINVIWCVLAKDYMPFHRHLVPALPFIYVLIASGLDFFASTRSITKGRIALGCGAAFALSTLLLATSVGISQSHYHNPIRRQLSSFLSNPILYTRSIADKIEHPLELNFLDQFSFTAIGTNYQALVGQFIKANYQDGSTIVYDQMGQTPYYADSDKTFIDSWGLVDRTIGSYYFKQRKDPSILFLTYDNALTWLTEFVFSETRDNLFRNQVLDHVFDAEPDVILINKALANNPGKLPRLLRHDPRFQADYEPVYLLAGIVRVYERKGILRSDTIVPPGLIVVEQRSGSWRTDLTPLPLRIPDAAN